MSYLVRQATIIAATVFVLFATPDVALANSTSSCSTNPSSPNYDPKCSLTCNLTDYFQFIFDVPTRPYQCRNIPSEFWVYQTQVGEVASNGKSAGGGASASSGVSNTSGGANAGMVTMTPSASISQGSALLYYNASIRDEDSAKAIEAELADEDEYDAPPLEKAVWVKLLGTFGRKNATEELASVRIQSGGVMVGTDLFSNEYLRFGILGSVSDISVEINENNNELDVFALKGGATATVEYGKWYLDGVGTYSSERTKTKRTVDVDGKGDLRDMTSKFTNHRIDAAFETGFRFTTGRLVIQPFAGVNMNWLKQQEAMEEGNRDAAVLTAKNTIFTGSSKLGVNASSAFLVGDGISIVPTVGAYWSHRFGELENANKISTNLGQSYEYVGAKPLLDVANVYAAVMANFGPNVAVSAGYLGSFNREERNHSANLGLRIRF